MKNACLCAVSRKIPAIRCLWYAGGLLPAQCPCPVGHTRTPGVYLHSCDRSSPYMEKADAPLNCGRNHLLYVITPFYFLIIIVSTSIFHGGASRDKPRRLLLRFLRMLYRSKSMLLQFPMRNNQSSQEPQGQPESDTAESSGSCFLPHPSK